MSTGARDFGQVRAGRRSRDAGRPAPGTGLSRRADFPLLAANDSLHYLDSAATSHKPRAVLEAMTHYYETANANPHRGAYELSARSTGIYHDSRSGIAAFFGIDDPARLVLTRGTTESINLIATSWGRSSIAAGDEIVITGMEHHANFIPWQQLALERGARLRICELTPDGRIDLDCLRGLLTERTRLVAFSHVSNALGTINPAQEIAVLVREHSDALIVCDGAQGAPHLAVDVDALGVDFYAFSGHKMCGPMGAGGLIGRRALLEAMPPYQFGGDMIDLVDDERSTWNVLPHKFEAGTPNVAGAVGLAAAVGYLQKIGMAEVRRHELHLVGEAHARLSEIPGLTIFGPGPGDRSGVISFTLADVHPHDLATILDGRGVCIRAGHHCAQPLMRRLGVAATARASFYIYNDADDVGALIDGIGEAIEMFGTLNA